MRQSIGNHTRQTGNGGTYYIWYFKDGRRSANADSCSSLEFAKERIAAKRLRKVDHAEVWYRNRELAFSTKQ